MSTVDECVGEWLIADLVDPRGRKVALGVAFTDPDIDAWPISWVRRKVGLLSNKKPNADAMLQEVKQGLLAAAPDLMFVYRSKEPLAEGAPAEVIDSLRDCDVVVLASAECGGCTSWVCRDAITLEKLGIPSMVIATHRFESLARGVLSAGGLKHPHLAIPKHPVSGITPEQAQAKIRDVMPHVTEALLGNQATISPNSAVTT